MPMNACRIFKPGMLALRRQLKDMLSVNHSPKPPCRLVARPPVHLLALESSFTHLDYTEG